MSNEAVTVELRGNQGDVVDFTVDDGTGISAGSIMHLLDPRTAVKSSATLNTEYFAGIAATDKEAGDGSTNLGCYTNGIFNCRVDGSSAVSAGQLLAISGSNILALASDDTIENHGKIVGKAMEDVASSTAETIEVAIGMR